MLGYPNLENVVLKLRMEHALINTSYDIIYLPKCICDCILTLPVLLHNLYVVLESFGTMISIISLRGTDDAMCHK